MSEASLLPLSIPRKVMQTWKTKNVPEKWQSSVTSIKKYLPGWEYTLMTDEDNRNFVKEHFPDFLEYFDDFPLGIQRADAIRPMWLYINGGLYMDLDIEVLGPLDNLFLEGKLFFVTSSNSSIYLTNCLMASAPGHPFWLEVIEEMKKPGEWWWKVHRMPFVLNSTGPGLLTRVAQETTHPYVLLPKSMVNPYSICDECRDQPTLVRNLEGGSWLGPDNYAISLGYCNSGWLSILGILVFFWLLTLTLLYFGGGGW